MNTTFVLGAGFSVYASDPSMPLAGELRKKILTFVEFDRHSSYSAFLEPGNGGFREGQFYAGLEEMDRAGGPHQFEELFAQLRRQHVTPDYVGPAYVTERVLRIGCARLFWCLHGLNPFPEWCYRNFASWLARSRGRNTVVSFNWDVVIETALTEEHVSWGYSLRDPVAVPILKPHGSINWNRYLRENLKNESGLWRPVAPDSGLSYPTEPPLKNPDQQGISPDLAYMLFPGDPDLPEQDKDLQRIWREVETALAGTEKVIFIGYSLPDYDSFSSMFFAKHVSGEVEVYNPSPVDQQKYRNLFGSRIVKEGGNFSLCPYAKG